MINLEHSEEIIGTPIDHASQPSITFYSGQSCSQIYVKLGAINIVTILTCNDLDVGNSQVVK